MALILGLNLPKKKKFKLLYPNNLPVCLKNNTPSLTWFGENLRLTLINMTKEARDSSMKLNLNCLWSKFSRKPLKENSTTFSGTCSESIPMQTKKSNSPNLYLSIYSGPLHPKPRWLDRSPTFPPWTNKGQKQSRRRITLHRILKRLPIPINHAQTTSCDLHHLQAYLQGRKTELWSLHELGSPCFSR